MALVEAAARKVDESTEEAKKKWEYLGIWSGSAEEGFGVNVIGIASPVISVVMALS